MERLQTSRVRTKVRWKLNDSLAYIRERCEAMAHRFPAQQGLRDVARPLRRPRTLEGPDELKIFLDESDLPG